MRQNMASPDENLGGRGGPVKLCMFGASPTTSNLGVHALFLSIADALAKSLPEVQLTAFDFGRGVRSEQLSIGGNVLQYTRCGANHSKRFYRSDSLVNMRVSAKFGGLGKRRCAGDQRS